MISYDSEYLLEPIGGAKPQFSSKSETSSYKVEASTQFALLCPAQAHPLPSYRLACEIMLDTLLAYQTQTFMTLPTCPALGVSHSCI